MYSGVKRLTLRTKTPNRSGTRIKAFQLGIGAPAMIAGFLSSSSNPATVRTAANISFITVVHAQTTPLSTNLKRFTLPTPSPANQFLSRLLGVQSKRVWFVIAGSSFVAGRRPGTGKKVQRDLLGHSR